MFIQIIYLIHYFMILNLHLKNIEDDKIQEINKIKKKSILSIFKNTLIEKDYKILINN